MTFVVATHGITGSGPSWNAVADVLGNQCDFVAPDLRGRGSRGNDGPPFGMAQHAADVVELLDARGVESAVIAGHSMGAFVAVVMAHLYPERVRSLVLVDGGLPLPVPAGLTVDQLLSAIIGPAMARLSMTFASREEYHDFWRQHPALGPYWNDYVEQYLDYDIAPSAGGLRSKVSIDAVRADAEDTLVTTTIPDAVAGLTRPAVLLRAEKGMMDEETPLVPEALAAQYPQVTDLGPVPGTNHYTILLSDDGAQAVAKAISEACA